MSDSRGRELYIDCVETVNLYFCYWSNLFQHKMSLVPGT